MTNLPPENNSLRNGDSTIGISKVVSHLNGWSLVEKTYPDHQADIADVVSAYGHGLLTHGFTTLEKKDPSDMLKSALFFGGVAYGCGMLLIKLMAFTGIGTNSSGYIARTLLHHFYDPSITLLSLLVGVGYILYHLYGEHNRSNIYNPEHVSKFLLKRGWNSRESITNKNKVGVRYIKDRIGLEIIPPKYDSFAESMFMNAEVSAGENEIDLVVLIVPEYLEQGVDSYDFYSGVIERFSHREHLPLSIPCAIEFIAKNAVDEPECNELTSEVDRILLHRTGQYLDDIIKAKEHTNWEFKAELNPDHGAARLLKTAVAFANHADGGVILIGVTDDGYVCGIPVERAEKDELSIRKCFRDNIHPKIELDYSRNELEIDGKVLLIIDIPSAKYKPIMANERVYHRNGTESIVADASEIRKMVEMNESHH